MGSLYPPPSGRVKKTFWYVGVEKFSFRAPLAAVVHVPKCKITTTLFSEAQPLFSDYPKIKPVLKYQVSMI